MHSNKKYAQNTSSITNQAGHMKPSSSNINHSTQQRLIEHISGQGNVQHGQHIFIIILQLENLKGPEIQIK